MKPLIALATFGLLSSAIAANETQEGIPVLPARLAKSAKAATPKAKSKKPADTLASQLAKLTTVETLRLQIFLDRAKFAPGKLDGLKGEFTQKAAQRWIKAEPNRSFASLLDAARDSKAPTTVPFMIPADAAKFVGAIPSTLEDKAAAKRLPYGSLAEYIAERFHTDESTLARLNPRINLTKLEVGDSLHVPNVEPFKIETPRNPPAPRTHLLAGISICILHDEHMLEVRDAASKLVAAFPITVGNKPEHLRTGDWKINGLAHNPTFTWDDEMLKNGIAGDKQYELPPGPNNPVGVLWMELEPVKGPEAHIGIHGTSDPTHIGRNHSSGCIRLANWDIVRLALIAGPGTKVRWQTAEPTTDLIAKAP